MASTHNLLNLFRATLETAWMKDPLPGTPLSIGSQ
jgi:hypothetical protein